MKFKFAKIIFLSVAGTVFLAGAVFAATNISSTDKYAWNDVIGWIDFYSTNTVLISDSNVTGYASSQIGSVALDCGTSPNPPADCATTFSDWKTTNDGLGNLSGWAWNDQIGWISLDCHSTSDNCLHSVYQVQLSGNDFIGWAWNDIVGWISFNCSNTSTCGTVNYKVASSGFTPIDGSITSSTYDTGAANGVIFTTLMYQGTKPAGTQVRFQFAASNNSAGPFTFSGYDGTDTTYYAPTGPTVPVALNPSLYANKRYFRYKVLLTTNSGRTVTPQVDDVTVAWSR